MPKAFPETVTPAPGAVTDVNLIQYLGVVCGPLNPVDTDPVDRAVRLLGIVYGSAGQILQLVPADALAPGNSLGVAGFNFVYNGATWDMVREGSVAGSVLTDQVDRATRLVGVIYGSEGQPLYQDPVEPAAVIISFSHHEIHEGNMYTTSVLDLDVDIAAPKYVMIRAPNTATRIHAIFAVSSSGAALAQLFENPTVTLDGAPLVELNNERNSPNVAEAATFEDPTIAADGTQLFAERLGGAGTGQRTLSGSVYTREEWVLLQAEDYIVKITVDADNTEVTLSIVWYEV